MESLNECVYIYSAMQAQASRCAKRVVYWTTIHKHRAIALGKKELV